MGMKWTREQERIIEHRDGNLLVSAAAGSGKTAVLVAHVISRITDPDKPCSLSELLLMTFTEAAAQEMRDRIRDALEERLRQEPDSIKLIRESSAIKQANISTIDSFCKRLISDNYALLPGIDPGFRIGDEGELKLLRSDIIAELLEERYLEGEESFLSFMDRFTRGKGDDGAEELINKLYEYSSAMPWPEDYLSSIEAGKDDEAESILLLSLKQGLEDVYNELGRALDICDEEGGPAEYVPMLTADRESILKCVSSDGIKELIVNIQSISFPRLKLSKAERREEAKELRDSSKKYIQDLQKRLILPPEDKSDEMNKGISDSARVLVSLCKDFMSRFRKEKDSRRMLDFSDLEHFALELLYSRAEDGSRHPSALADDYAMSFREILVDEYQDSNEVQECLISALSAERFGRPNVFQVGDIKQSIYSFREARPELFLSKYRDKSYPKIELDKNFRSRKEVLTSCNQVFERIMRPELGGIDYNNKVSLKPGRMIEDDKRAGDYRTELLLCEYGELEQDGDEISVERIEAEARLIAGRIRELREEGYSYRDIVILMRSPGSVSDSMVEVLSEEGIPAYSVSREGYFSAPEVETVLAFLSIIDNPRQSIPLAAVMRSPIYGFTDEELALIAAKNGGLERSYPEEEELIKMGSAQSGENIHEKAESRSYADPRNNELELSEELLSKLDDFRKSLWHYRELSRYLSIHELLYSIYEESGYYNYVSALPAGRKRRANLDQLIDSALSFEKTSYRGLFDYIRYIEKLKKYNSDQGEASIYSDSEELVRIISMHKSKGLQFPVVFLAGLGRAFNTRDLSGKLLIDARLGLAMDYVDTAEKLRYPSLKKLALRTRLEEQQLSEELRVLYVAMTRAEDKLIMTASVSDIEKKLSRLPERSEALGKRRISSARSMLDWILMAEGDRLLSAGEDKPIRLKTVDISGLLSESREELNEKLDVFSGFMEEIDSYDTDRQDYKQAKERINYVYPHEQAVRLFPKYTVSEIKKARSEGRALIYIGNKPESELAQDLGECRDNEEKPQSVVSAAACAPDFSEPDYDEWIELRYEELSRGTYPAEASGKPQISGGARAGDAYHHALAYYDYEREPSQLSEYMPESELELIDIERLKKFLASRLGQSLKAAAGEGKLFREQSFMKEVKYSYLFPESDTDERVLLQGIIDAFIIEEDGITLIDYKTDRINNEKILIDRYAIQLRLYGDALTGITGIPVKRKLIYSFALEKAVEIPDYVE